MSTGSLGVWVYAASCGIPAAVVAVAALTTSAVRRRREQLIATTGRHTTGRVQALGCDADGLGGSSYWVSVRYEYDGEPVTARVVVGRRDQQRYQVGQRVGLTYAPSRHQIVNLDPAEWGPPPNP